MSENRFQRPNRLRRAARSPARRLLDFALAGGLLFALIFLVARLDRAREVTHGGAPVVNDGDSLTLDGVRIRLKGIDAPELHQDCTVRGKPYSCGRQARDALQSLVRGGQVQCRGTDEDQYGRLLAICTAGTVNLNAAMVEAGWALAYGDYETLEARARAARKGVWTGEFERPRDWRRHPGEAAKPPDDPLARLGDTIRKWLSSLLAGG